MNTVRIYKLTTINRYYKHKNESAGKVLQERYSFKSWQENGHLEGYDDGGQEYILPDGYYLSTDRFEDKVIRNKDGKIRSLRRKNNEFFVKEGMEKLVLRLKDKK